jgi:curli biogenesis system outer membrane secretion channel CsgG
MKVTTALFALAACLALCVNAHARTKKEKEVKQAEGAQASAAAPADPGCTGPRKRLAVLKFGGTGKYGSYEGWDVGEAVAAQLATALDQSQCFIVVDRLALSEVLREQELGLAGVTNRETAAHAGGLIGAQILVKGEITEFEPGKKGHGMTAGIGLANIPLGLRLGGNKSTAHLALDVRLIDASSGQVLFTQRVDSEAKSFGLAFGVDWKKASIGNDNFSKTPLGEAMREAVTEAAGYIMTRSREVDWTGQIVEVQGPMLYLNAGSAAGIKVGDTLNVFTVARELIDPATGLSLGRIEEKLGQVRVDHVDDKYSTGQCLGEFKVRRGDLLRMDAPARTLAAANGRQ